jgi:NAD-dependent deacetylase
VVIGTTGATHLPLQIGELAARSGCPIVVINPEPNPFSEWVAESRNGLYLEGRAGDWVPVLVRQLCRLQQSGDASSCPSAERGQRR